MFKNINNNRNYDLFIVVLLILCISTLLIKIDAFELFTEFSRSHESYELDEIILILLVSSFCILWYAIRRYNENKKLQIKIEEINKKLNNENIKKDNLLIEQSKMAALGEMLNNIAHQWRQPLSVISTSASGLKLLSSLGSLDEKDLNRSLDSVLRNTKYLSETIDNFRNFIKNDDSQISFNVNLNINKNLNILEPSLKISHIDTVLDLNTDININNYPNELTQVFINIINNAKDAFEINSIKKRYIFVSSKVVDNKVILKITDNANGIPSEVIDKIFEPYFTTKHKSNGTGLGLYMAYKIITEHMRGEIFVQNITFTHNDESFKGAEFTIILDSSLRKSSQI